ncbi:ap-2 complex subunit mu [Nannochloropsis gaditana]|uniref:Ap-2 complex subunit mu n=1 Tax=Nannochloropsis gaditana TaxID=72520 RepID=W7TZC4_9STRA|nr:ap-2 complex subunit mu [Nannochloropsis gaditana]
MISAIFLVNQKGEVVVNRLYRDDVSRSMVDTFRHKVIASKETGSQAPIKVIENATFLYIRHHHLYLVAVTRSNLNPALVFEFLFRMVRIFKAYFGEHFDESAVRNHFTLVYELLDETMDFGYPQNCAIEVLRQYINLGTVQAEMEQQEPTVLTSQITGQIDWRRDGIRYRKNEVYIDVLESVNILMSATGNVLHSDVTGQIVMKALLSGWPECKFGLNDKLIMDREAAGKASGAVTRRSAGVEIDDCTFHRCVRLGRFDADRTITFIPPDGEFELMRYRVTENVNLPFRLIPAIQEEGRNRVAVNVKVTANFSSKLFGQNVVIKVPVPPNTAKTHINVSTGRARFEPEHRALVWRIKRFPGGCEFMITADVTLMPSTSNKAWSRPPIQVEFQVPMFTSSGVHVRFLRVYDKSGYQTNRWVRYITRAGSFSVRI